MTEDLLRKLEEKMMALFSELEDARKEVSRLGSENAFLKSEKENYSKKVEDLLSEKANHSKKVEDLLSLFEDINTPDVVKPSTVPVQHMKPALVQG